MGAWQSVKRQNAAISWLSVKQINKINFCAEAAKKKLDREE